MQLIRFTGCILLLLMNIHSVKAQFTVVKGVITDAETREPLPFVNIVAEGGKGIGTTTDFSGQFVLQSINGFTKIRIQYLGYKSETRVVISGKSQVINIQLKKEAKELKEVTVKAGRRKYKNKENPAVDLIKLVIDHKKYNRREELAAYQLERYEKVQFALSNITEKFKNRRFMKNFQFVFQNIDTTKLKGKEILPMYITENITDVYYRQSPREFKEVVKGSRRVNFDEYFDNSGINNFIQYLYQDIDVYKNNFILLTNQFVSPASDVAPLFYRYYIMDTLMVDTSKCVRLAFFPRNKSDFLLQGELFITLDGNYAIRKNEMSVSPEINLNFIKELRIVQEYKQVEKGDWLISSDELSVDFGITSSGMGLFGQRYVSYKDYVLNQARPDEFYKETIIPIDSATNRSNNFWEESRHLKLTDSEAGVIAMMDTIQKIPAFRRTMNWIMLLTAGYRDFGQFEIGPVNTFYSYNPIEGVRVRVGGRTTPKFSKRFNFETYGAYGFLDDQWKYYVGSTFALGSSIYNQFPLKWLRVSYQEETKIPGQELQFVQEDNVLLSIKRGENNKILYNKIFNMEFLQEFHSHLSYGIGFKHWEQSPAGTLFFNRQSFDGMPEYRIRHATTSEMSFNLRYAPEEQFYQGKLYRTPMYNKYPVLQARLIAAIPDLAGGEYEYQKLSFSIFKRFYISPFGYTDVLAEAGQIFGTVPYPFLEIHRANQTFSYQLQSYNLMNFLEFVSDRYVSANIDHHFNGFVFNKIPLLKKLKLREVITMKILYGTLSDRNDPDKNPNVFKFPMYENGDRLTYTLEKQPYIEASVGIANIFKLFRVDLIRRFTYLDHPVVSEFGLRGRFKFDF